MKELIEYLIQNKIYYEPVDDDFVTINEELYYLVRPDEDGLLFTEDLILIADEPTCAKYVYNFGGNWYWDNKEDYDKPKLNELKYIGKSIRSMDTEYFLGIRGTYEILNGSRLYEDWCKKAKFLGCEALGICEKNTLAGLLKFQIECQKNKIKPILGATYTVLREKEDLKYDIKCYVRDEIGWQNLLAINKEINVINNKFIHENRFLDLLEGLIVVVDPKSLPFKSLGDLLKRNVVDYFQLDSVEFTNNDRDREYLENLKRYVRSDLRPIAITDAFYLDKEHSHIKRTLNAISGVRESESNNQHFKDKDEYCDEIESLFNKKDDTFFDIFGRSLAHEHEVVKKCNFSIVTSNKYLPKYEMTEEEKSRFDSSEDLFWHLIKVGLDKTGKSTEEYLARIEKEFVVIEKGGFVDYFLILWDIIRFARENKILSGIGRGSAGGSLIAYLLGIIKLDPLQFDLLFERFLNEGRIGLSLPDIDSDFMGTRRNEIKRYMESKYGKEQVCSVGTYTTLKIKGAVKELARLEMVNAGDMNYLTTILDLEKDTFLELFQNAAKKKPLKAFVQNYPDLINTIPLLLKQPKTSSIHACATLILPNQKTVYEWLPVKLMTLSDGEEMIVTEWEGPELEQAGFLKEDILGIKQLDKFQSIIELIKNNHGIEIDLEEIDLNNRKVYSYFKKGWNADVFHFGSTGLTGYCKQLKPDNIDDLIAGIALYRPGSMESNFHNEYVLRKDGERQVEYDFGLEEVTKQTYGLYIFQEQILKACMVLGGINLVDADDVRRAMGKKKKDVIDKYGAVFVEGAKKKGCDEEVAREIWEKLEKFASYGFNKSHAAAYAITGYISQWFKVNYPIEYWSTAFGFSEEKDHANYISEINQTGAIKVMPANINKSRDNVYTDFVNKIIYWPLISIKQCGEKAASQIIELRDNDGQYFSFEEFIQRNKFKGSKVTKQVIENLILSGAFDDIENLTTFESRYKLILQYRKISKTKIDLEKDIFETNKTKLREEWWWILQQKRLSGIAFFDYRDLTNRYLESDLPYIESSDFQNESNADTRKKVKIGGYITEVEERTSKKGKWARIKLENNYTFINVVIWAEQYKQIESLNLAEKEKSLLLITGQISNDSFHKENVLQANDDTELLILI